MKLIKYVWSKIKVLDFNLIRAIDQDPMFFDILPIYCVCLYELNKLGDLY
jgi:hypothetical protein